MNPANEVYFAMEPAPRRRSGPAALNYTGACGSRAGRNLEISYSRGRI